MTITFVSSFFYIYTNDYSFKTTEWRIERFCEIADTGINICLFVCPHFQERMIEICKKYDNIILIVIDLKDTFIYQTCEKYNSEFPSYFNKSKDIVDYVKVINLKPELMTEVIQKNPYKSTHFAWIDFNISYIFSEKEKTLSFLKHIANQQFKKGFFIPGCWEKNTNIHLINENINWRFCGGFFIGDKNAILHFNHLYQTYFPQFLKNRKKLVWEVNFWTWLELNTDWNPIWYYADHNDGMFMNVKQEYYLLSLKKMGSISLEYNYPKIDNYFPASISYLYFNGQHILNTQYSGKEEITKNMCSFLDYQKEEFSNKIIPVFLPQNYEIMKYSQGVDDICLYSFENKVKFIATTSSHTSSHTFGHTFIMIGDYDINTFEIKNTRTLCNTDSFEKKWIPIIKENKEYFIYKWSPFEIGKIQDNKLEIIQSYETNSFFKRIKGSSIFVESENGYIGVVHYSEEKKPREYFHMLVKLDKYLRPISYSDAFYFQNIGIEFCIGFTIKDNNYLFWISQMDRDPLFISIECDKIKIDNLI